MRPSARTKRRILYSLLAISFITISACTDAGLLLPAEEDESRIEILMVEGGTVLVPEDTISIELIFDGDELQTDRMDISLLDSDRVSLFSQTLGAEEIQALPTPVLIPTDMPTGQYIFEVTLYYLDELVAQKQAEVFVAAEPFTILGVVPYPDILYPGGRGLIRAGIEIPEGSDPFLRWRTADGIIAEGYLSEGLDEIEVDVPEREGVFSISLELFPLVVPLFEPPSEDITSSNRFDVQLFVSKDQSDEPHELGPAENYATLFHFRGETIDRGWDSATDSVTENGRLQLAIRDDSFGFLIDEDSGLILERSLIPFDDDSIHPFTLSVRAVFEQYGTIYTTRDENGDVFAELVVDMDGYPSFNIAGYQSRATDIAVPLAETVEISVSVVPDEGSLRFLWFLSGYPAGDETIAIEDAVLPVEEPYSTVGGDSTINALIDELGVFSVAEQIIDTSIFSRAMRLEYDGDLLFAEGFDGISLSENLGIESSETDVSVEGGSLVIPPASSIVLPPIPVDFNSLSIEIAPGAGQITIDAFVEVNSSPSLGRIVRLESKAGYISADDELIYTLASETIDGETDTAEPIRIDLGFLEGAFSLLVEETEFDLGRIPYSDANIVISVGAMDDEVVSIDSILITKNRVDRLLSASL